MKKTRCIFLFACLLALALCQSSILPAPALAAPKEGKKKPAQTLLVSFSRFPTSSVCMPGVQEIQYYVSTPNGKYTGIGIQYSAKLGTTDSSYYDSDTGIGGFFYYPKQEGQETLTIIVTKGSLKSQDKVSFKNENCKYAVYIKGLYEVNTEGAKLYAELNGEGSFTKDPETGSPSGDGTASLKEDVSSDVKVVTCKLTPSIDMSFSFKVVEGDLAPLTPANGQRSSSFTLSLKFDKSEYPSLAIHCVTIEGKEGDVINIPSGEADLNSIINVENMFFTSEGGEYPFKFSKGSGTVTVVPKSKGK